VYKRQKKGSSAKLDRNIIDCNHFIFLDFKGAKIDQKQIKSIEK
jgi:hypothetical protein